MYSIFSLNLFETLVTEALIIQIPISACVCRTAERLIIKILCLFVSVEKIWTHTHESLLLYTFAFNVFESSQVGEVELSLF